MTDADLVAAFDRTMAALKIVGLVLGIIVAAVIGLTVIGVAVYVGGWVGVFFLVGLGICIAITLEERPLRIRARNASRMLLPRWARSPRRTSVPRPAPRG